MQLSESDIAIIEQVKHTIQSSVFNQVSIIELCSIAGMGRNKLMRGFYLLNKKTIYQYRLTVSMEYAKSLLEDGRLVKEIAILLGYGTTGHFTRAFIKVFGEPPSRFCPRHK